MIHVVEQNAKQWGQFTRGVRRICTRTENEQEKDVSKKSQESKKTADFRELRDKLGWTVPRIAATLGLSTSAVVKRLAGDCNVRAGELAALRSYLATGEGGR